jgi:hypothetical protein
MTDFKRGSLAVGLTVFLILVLRLQKSYAQQLNRTALPIPDIQ